MAGTHLLAIDQGTTSSRSIVFDRQGNAVSSAQQEFAQHYPDDGWVEHDAEEIWQSVLYVTRKALDDHEGGAADIAAINARGELAVILSTEGAHMVERDTSRLDVLAKHGLRRLQPIHYVASDLGDSQTDPPRFSGLSDLGREVLSKASELGMLIDLAHASEAVVKQTVELVQKPLVISHTMVKYNSAAFGDYRATRQRWITPEHARIVADTGGVIGTFPIRAPFGVSTIDAFTEALKVMVDAVGIDHVAWSTDLGEPVRPAFLQDYRQFPYVCARLLERGFSDTDLMKFVGGNALRVQAEA